MSTPAATKKPITPKPTKDTFSRKDILTTVVFSIVLVIGLVGTAMLVLQVIYGANTFTENIERVNAVLVHVPGYDPACWHFDNALREIYQCPTPPSQ